MGLVGEILGETDLSCNPDDWYDSGSLGVYNRSDIKVPIHKLGVGGAGLVYSEESFFVKPVPMRFSNRSIAVGDTVIVRMGELLLDHGTAQMFVVTGFY